MRGENVLNQSDQGWQPGAGIKHEGIIIRSKIFRARSEEGRRSAAHFLRHNSLGERIYMIGFRKFLNYFNISSAFPLAPDRS